MTPPQERAAEIARGLRKLTEEVDVGGGAWMTIPDPRAIEDGGLEWCLRYTCGDLPNNVQFQAASVVASISYLLGDEIPTSEAIGRLRIMRRAYAALLAAQPAGGRDGE